MAISKITLNGVVQIDLTSDTVTAQTLVDDYVAHGADGTTVTGELVLPTARTASDVTVSGATVTIPAGAYSSQVQKSVANAEYSVVVDNDYTTQSGQRKWLNTGWVDIESGGYVGTGVINVIDTTYNAVPANTTVTPTTSAQTIGGTNYMMEGAVTVSAMPTGTAGTPTASKGAVSNHSVSITPSVTNVTGYISGGTKTGTAVTVTASELASGNKAITQNGSDIDVVGYSTVSVDIPTSPYTEADMKKMVERSTTFTSFTIPSNVTKIGDGAFYDCSELNFASLPSGITGIGERAFYECSKLTLTSLPSGITTIGQYAFYMCTRLALTSLPSGITSIGQYAFYRCSSMPLTSLPSGLTTISAYAFQKCSSLAITSIPSGVTSIGLDAFEGCTGLTQLSLPNGLTSIGSMAFANCTNLAITTLPSTVTSIGSQAFSNCESITTITCESTGLKTISGGAFTAANVNYSMNLREAHFPYMDDGETGTTAFGAVFGNSTASYACQQLEIADIGKNYSITSNAFANCYKLQTLILRKSSVCTLSYASAFTNTPMSGYNGLTGTVYVPSALISSYQTANNWKTLYNNGTVTFSAIEGSDYEL